MSITIDTADAPGRWNRYVDRSPHAGVFHRHGALSAQAEHAGATLHAYVGYKGQEPVGLFPVFEFRKGLVPVAFSPPPSLRVPYLGPAMLNVEKLTRRKAERRLRRFVQGVLDELDASFGPRYVHARTVPVYPDLRPFLWRGFRARPSHTYVVDLGRGREELLAAFSSDARRNVTGTDADAYEVAVGGVDAVEAILRQVRARYESQGVDFEVPTAFAVDLYEGLPDGAVRPYVLRTDGEFVGGILALDDGERVYRWQGGVRTEGVEVPANDLLDWRVMTDALDRGAAAYDLVGADNERINRYKAKFSPELRTFHSLERGSTLVSLLARGYRHIS